MIEVWIHIYTYALLLYLKLYSQSMNFHVIRIIICYYTYTYVQLIAIAVNTKISYSGSIKNFLSWNCTKSQCLRGTFIHFIDLVNSIIAGISESRHILTPAICASGNAKLGDPKTN